MKLFGLDIRRETRASAEDPRVPISAENFLEFMGIETARLPAVTLASALTVPAFAAAVTFLPSTLANLPIHVFRTKPKGTEKLPGALQSLVNEAPNDEWTSYDWRKYHWHQVFTGGRGLSWIERNGSEIVGIWPMEPSKTVVKRVNGRKFYEFQGKKGQISAADVIDTPFLLKPDQTGAYSPLVMAKKALQLALAMGDYASGFFAGGGVPPLALVGPLPAGPDAIKRAQADIKRAIDLCKFLNEMVDVDPLAMYRLMQHRTLCSERMWEALTERHVSLSDCGPLVGMFGILNRWLAQGDEGCSIWVTCDHSAARVLRFEVHVDQDGGSVGSPESPPDVL